MKRRIGFFGVFGLVFLLFGILGQFLIAYDEYHFVPVHFAAGGISILIFLIGGGLHGVRSTSFRKKAGFGVGALVYTVLFVAVLSIINMWFFRHDPLRFDSTAEKAYTLSPETVATLSSLGKPVVARAFNLGGKLDPPVEALLKRFAQATPNFRWLVIDPEKKPQLVDEFGISQSGTIHFSFEGEEKKREAKIARDITEQEIVNALLKLKRGEGKKVYYIVGHGEPDLDSQTDVGYLFLRDFIHGENLKLEKVSLGASGDLPADAAAVLLMGPKKQLVPEELQKLQTYLARGGAMVLADEPHTTGDIAALLSPLGISVGNDVIVDQALTGFGIQVVVSQYGVHPVTSGFGGSTVFSTIKSVTRAATVAEGVRVTELAFSGEHSWAEKEVDRIYSEKPEATPNPDERHGPVPVAVAYEGLVPYRLPEGAKPGKARLVVFGDSEFVSNTNIKQLYNSDLFLNSLNWVLGEDQGVTIRPRTIRQSSKIISADQMARVFLAGGVLFPEFLLLFGLAVWWRRRT